jgi:hypothetical protein
MALVKMTDEFENEVVHPQPVWRDRANYILGGSEAGGDGTEQLWARNLGGNRFEICCIPFILYGLALGDIVEADEHSELTGVIKNSNRSVFRARFGNSAYPRDEIEQGVSELGALVEWSSDDLLAVDAADADTAAAIFAYLEQHQNDGHLMVETGKWLTGTG